MSTISALLIILAAFVVLTLARVQPLVSNSSHTFPRLANCWGAGERLVTAEQWRYLGFSNVTNATWSDYDVLYINPVADFGPGDALDSWAATVRAIKKGNPTAVVLGTFHTTEVWYKDMIRPGSGQSWLPVTCIMRNANGTPCDWWVPFPDGIITTNMFRDECLASVTNYALAALPELVDAGMDGVFLDGLIPFSYGCTAVDVNCTSPDCHGTPSNTTRLGPLWWPRFGEWFSSLKAQHPGLLWINNGPFPPTSGGMDPSGAGATYMLAHSNGRMIEGATGGALAAYEGHVTIGNVIDAVSVWTNNALQPSYVSVHMSMAHPTQEHVGLWQNAVNGAGDMMRMCRLFEPMRWGLGVALLTDGYFGHDPAGGAFYGVPTWYTEYEADLGHALGPATMLASQGTDQVWMRGFERGLVVVNGLRNKAHSFSLPMSLQTPRRLVPSKRPWRITTGVEAPVVQFVVDNDAPYCGVLGPSIDWSAYRCGYRASVVIPPPSQTPTPPGARNCSLAMRKESTDCPLAKSTIVSKYARAGGAVVASGGIEACCELCVADPTCTGWVWDTVPAGKDPDTPYNCWPLSSYQTEKSIPQRVFGAVGATPPNSPSYTWTAVTDPTLHHVGPSYDVSLLLNGDSWPLQPRYEAVWGFTSPTTDTYAFSVSHVSSSSTPLTDAAQFCLRLAGSTTCVGEGAVDQRNGDGNWIHVMGGVQLSMGADYEMVLTWDPSHGGFAAADALLVESDSKLNDGASLDRGAVLSVPPMDSRIIKHAQVSAQYVHI